MTQTNFQTQPRVPLLTMGKPPGRKECGILEQWVRRKIKEGNSEDSQEKKRLIIEFALLEAIRQVTNYTGVDPML
jgi:hypothetical protein